MRVLISDNSSLIIQKLHELLSETTGVSALYQAANYLQALQCFKSNEPDIVVLGLNFPAKLSFLLLKTIKGDTPKTVVIVLSINMDDYMRQQCKMLGADFFLDKHNEFEKVPIIINEFVDKKKGGIAV